MHVYVLKKPVGSSKHFTSKHFTVRVHCCPFRNIHDLGKTRGYFRYQKLKPHLQDLLRQILEAHSSRLFGPT